MRIISINTLRIYWIKNRQSEQALKAWIQEVSNSGWVTAAELKEKYRHASIINSKRVVFNIRGNSYRLIVDVEYRLRIVFIVWIGTHAEYDKLDVKKVRYVKTNKG